MSLRIINRQLYVVLSLLAMMLCGCASISTPQGGPRDERPPRMVRAFPAPGATDVSTSNVTIDFDEFITLKDAFSNVVISPTSEHLPRVTGVGRKVTVNFIDSLLPNTTYSIDFGDAIQDNNEGNALQGFTYTFSTGPELDSLRISGMVLDSHTLEPQQGILVGVHTSDADSAFNTLRMVRVTRTDDRGRFTLRGLKGMPYRLFALKDINGDFRWDNPEEIVAFYGDPIIPTASPTTVSDTIYNHVSVTVDSVVERYSTLYLPNDILLSSFSVGYKPQYLKSYERPDTTRAILLWNAPNDTLPPIRLLDNPKRTLSDWAMVEKRLDNDSVTLWIHDPNLLASDTLRLVTDYKRHINRHESDFVSDTITLTMRRIKASSPKKGKTVEMPVLEVKSDNTSVDFPNPFVISFSAPPRTINPAMVHLDVKRDTLWIPVSEPLQLERADTLNPRLYKIKGNWEYGGNYRLTLDSLAVTDIYGHQNKIRQFSFSIPKVDEYGTITFTLSGLGTMPAFVELLDGSDRVIRTVEVKDGRAIFRYLKPASYYARVIFDANANGKYDSGDPDANLQPEAVAYFTKKITLRKNWDQNLSWNVSSTPVDQQKPASLKRNKPKKKKGESDSTKDEETEEPFDPAANPFDPNQRRNRNNNR